VKCDARWKEFLRTEVDGCGKETAKLFESDTAKYMNSFLELPDALAAAD
jgi:hypothetical protein